jgi:putative heme-binding domain-containing protein
MPAQLDDGAGQLEKLRDIGALTPVLADGKPKQATANLKPKLKLVDPHGISHGLESRARSYLHVNCAHCHQSGGGGNAVIDVRFDLPLKQTQAWDARPMQGTFDIPEARILAPGDPCRSILYFRMAKLGPGRMPHIGSTHVDRRGLALIHDWLAQGKTGEDPLLAKIASDADRGAAIEALLSSIPGSLRLMRAFDMGTIPPAARASVLKAAMTRDGPVRDLFEPFVPDEQRVTRLGVNVRPETLLTAKGDAVRGRDVYLKTAGLNCAACHKFAGQGGAVGPELEGVGKRLTKAQIVESLLDPSKTIDPKFTSYLLETKAGKVHTGIIVTRTESEIVLRDAQNREIRVPANQIATFEPQKKSLMPEQQLGGLTLRQAADLIAFLESLK